MSSFLYAVFLLSTLCVWFDLTKADDLLLEGIKKLENTIENIIKNPVPIGFIYVQLPGQPEPKTLWPIVEWENIGSNYSGHFFRVEGGNAGQFGQSQSDAFQGHHHPLQVTRHVAYAASGDYGIWAPGSLDIVSITDPISDGKNGGPRTASETRPINYSVRVWKRVN